MEIILRSEIVYHLLYFMSVWAWVHSCSNERECVRATLRICLTCTIILKFSYISFAKLGVYVCLI